MATHEHHDELALRLAGAFHGAMMKCLPQIAQAVKGGNAVGTFTGTCTFKIDEDTGRLGVEFKPKHGIKLVVFDQETSEYRLTHIGKQLALFRRYRTKSC